MSTRSNRILRHFVIVLGAIAALIVAIGGLPSFLWATAKRLHPELSRQELLHQHQQTFQDRECRELSPLYRGESASRPKMSKGR